MKLLPSRHWFCVASRAGYGCGPRMATNSAHDNPCYHVFMASLIGPLPSAALPRQADSDEQAIALWLHGKSSHSARAYRSDMASFQRLVGKPLAATTLADLQLFADSINMRAPASQKRILASVKSLLTFCHKIGYLPFNVGAALTQKRPKNTLAERILTREAVLKMLVLETGPRNRALLQFLYETGCRVSEVCSLEWKDLQSREQAAQATIFGKGGKTRTVLFSADLYAALAELRNEAGGNTPVFPSKSGRHLDQPAVFRLIREAAVKAGISSPVSPHWLRHACASHALDAGAPISLVKAQLGHASLETTSVYLHARPDDGLFRYLRK
jgi:integrase/recombinase XerD